MPADQAAAAGPVRRSDAVAVGLLVAVPLIVLALPALAGYPLLTGDDLVQNFPLAAYAGELLRHGHLPVYDAYLWSGSPLLAAANAHALLPTTVLFAVLPALAAWVLAEGLTLAAAALAVYVLLRRNGCRPLAAGLGGATFGLGGFVSSQVLHIDFVSAAAALAWALVALHGLATGRRERAGWWALLLAGSVAYVALAASPDIVVDAAVVGAVYLAQLCWSQPGRRLALVAWAAAGTVVGVLLGAVQWLPTSRFVADSQRAHTSFAYASAGSVSARELLLSLLPHVLGGGPLGLKTYAGPYNLAELDAYVGVLGLAAVGGLVARWRAPGAGRWRVWYVAGAACLLLALGANTPLEHLVVRLPVVGDQRLPSRALIGVALAGALLLGYFVEDLVARARPDATTAPPPSSSRRRVEVACSLVGPVAVLALIAATVVAAAPDGGALAPVAGDGWSLAAIAPYLAVTAAVAGAAVAVLALAPRLTRRRLSVALLAVVVVDLVAFAANQSSLAPAYARELGRPNALERALAARLDGGRFLVVDPARSTGIALNLLGAPDDSSLDAVASAQGYGSLVWGPYAEATGTHSQDNLAPASLAGPIYDAMDVRYLLTVPSLLAVELGAGSAPVVANRSTPDPDSLPLAVVGQVPGTTRLAPGSTVVRYFGTTLDVAEVELRLAPAGPGPAGAARLGRSVAVVAGGGRASPLAGPGAVHVAGRLVTIRPASGRRGVGVELRGLKTAPAEVSSIVVTTAQGTRYALDGALSRQLTVPHWRPDGHLGPFSLFANDRARGAWWTTAAGAGAVVAPGASSAATGSETVTVSSRRPVVLVRSVADLPGWQVTERHDGATRSAGVFDVDLAPAVRVPAGLTVLTFSYHPPGLATGLWLSAAGLAGAVLLALGATVAGRRARRRRPTAPPGA